MSLSPLSAVHPPLSGCIGGIGVFLFTTGLEGSTNHSFEWNISTISLFFSFPLLPLWGTSLLFELLLRLLQTRIKEPLLAPFYFLSVPIVFYIVLFLFNFNISDMHDQDFFFQGVTGSTNYLLIWELIDLKSVNWHSIVKALPTILALTIFSLMHVPVSTYVRIVLDYLYDSFE